MASKTISTYKQDYSKPSLRIRLKEKLLRGTKGGKSGQWTARKAQLLVKEYQKNNGNYKKNNKTKRSKQSLDFYNQKAKNSLTTKTYKPTLKIARNAALGLKLHKEFKKGGTVIGIKRATDLKNQKLLSIVTLRRMYSYFARHTVDKKAENFGSKATPSAGYIAWLLWGGDDAKDWINRKLNK